MNTTRHGDVIARIVNAYAAGPGLVAALETYVQTVEDRAHDEGMAALAGQEAAKTCERMHDGPPTGLVCRACFEAVTLAPYIMQVAADQEIDKKKR